MPWHLYRQRYEEESSHFYLKVGGGGVGTEDGVIDQPRVSGIPGGESSGGVYTRILSNLSFISHTNWNTYGYNGLEVFSFLEDLENRPTNKN